MEKGILFNTDMVKAILEGRKTTTRRIIKPQPKEKLVCVNTPFKRGDILYVRETWWLGDILDGSENIIDKNVILYKAGERKKNIEYGLVKWKPSIHMPKKIARLYLRVIDVQAKKLNDMNDFEFVKEGVSKENALFNFSSLWDSTLKKENIAKYSWSSNPWVWVIEFQVIERGKYE